CLLCLRSRSTSLRSLHLLPCTRCRRSPFCFSGSADLRSLHVFPPRRSSDPNTSPCCRSYRSPSTSPSSCLSRRQHRPGWSRPCPSEEPPADLRSCATVGCRCPLRRNTSLVACSFNG